MTNLGLAAGWYPDQIRPDLLRYWDGENWTGQTAVKETLTHSAVTRTPARRGRWLIASSVIALIAIGVAAVLFANASPWSTVSEEQDPTRPVSIEPVSPKPEPELATNSEPDGPGDSFYERLGYEVLEPGRIYALAAEPADFTCGSYDCLYYTIVALGGCPTNLYVEASILSQDVVVGYANDLVGAVAPGEDATVLMEDYSGAGDSFRISKANCY